MLSIAYGGDQSDTMAVHKPEVCYPAQGFQILKNATASFSTGDGNIPVKRLVATQGPRIEPITYWTTVGDTVAVSGYEVEAPATEIWPDRQDSGRPAVQDFEHSGRR